VDWPEAGLLLLNMRGNRWCGNIGRAHKSNGIFYVVDLQACSSPAAAVAFPAYQLCWLVLTTDGGNVYLLPCSCLQLVYLTSEQGSSPLEHCAHTCHLLGSGQAQVQALVMQKAIAEGTVSLSLSWA
jgi:hypothetical protein